MSKYYVFGNGDRNRVPLDLLSDIHLNGLDYREYSTPFPFEQFDSGSINNGHVDSMQQIQQLFGLILSFITRRTDTKNNDQRQRIYFYRLFAVLYLLALVQVTNNDSKTIKNFCGEHELDYTLFRFHLMKARKVFCKGALQPQ
jgi:hypothetical protein